jgi:hypothetical protein
LVSALVVNHTGFHGTVLIPIAPQVLLTIVPAGSAVHVTAQPNMPVHLSLLLVDLRLVVPNPLAFPLQLRDHSAESLIIISYGGFF